MLGVFARDDFQCLIGEPADTFQFVLQKQAGIHGYDHTIFVGVQA
jgi:hypothetical protein